ncbi:MAG: hypothetical protein RRZ68_04845, partial [Oscillospiraceae bacterium]
MTEGGSKSDKSQNRTTSTLPQKASCQPQLTKRRKQIYHNKKRLPTKIDNLLWRRARDSNPRTV